MGSSPTGGTSRRPAARSGREAVRLSRAELDGDEYHVTRHSCTFVDDAFDGRTLAVTGATVPADQLAESFPELAGPHWRRCAGTVRR